MGCDYDKLTKNGYPNLMISEDDLRTVNTNSDNMRYLIKFAVECYLLLAYVYPSRRFLKRLNKAYSWYFQFNTGVADSDIDFIHLLSTFIGNQKDAADNFIHVNGIKVFKLLRRYLLRGPDSLDLARNLKEFTKSVLALSASEQ